MGTHPIFESDFDCLTVFKMDSDSDDNLIDDGLPPAQFGFLNLRQTGGQGGGQTTTNRKKETRAKYRDYHSIDWLRELSRDRQRHHLIANDRASGRFDLRCYSIFDKCSGWLVVLCIGIAAGLAAGIVDITTKWLSDLKLGLCSASIFLNQEQCCWGDYDIEDLANCTQWKTWNQLFGMSGPVLLGRLRYRGFGQLYPVENVESALWHVGTIGRILRVGLFRLRFPVCVVWRFMRFNHLLLFAICHWQRYSRGEDNS